MSKLVYRCQDCDYEGMHRGAFEQCWIDNHSISERPVIETDDPIKFPKHYLQGKFEAIEVMEDWFSDDPLLFTALKYVARCKHKGNLIQDLRKAIWYIERRITKEETNERT